MSAPPRVRQYKAIRDIGCCLPLNIVYSEAHSSKLTRSKKEYSKTEGGLSRKKGMSKAGKREDDGSEYSKNIRVWKYHHEANSQHNQDQVVERTRSEYVLPLIPQDNHLKSSCNFLGYVHISIHIIRGSC